MPDSLLAKVIGHSYMFGLFKSILFLVKEEILLTRIIRPNIFDTLIDFALIFHLLEILNNFKRSTRTHGRNVPSGDDRIPE